MLDKETVERYISQGVTSITAMIMLENAAKGKMVNWVPPEDYKNSEFILDEPVVKPKE